jgi:hypothetical protein
MRVAGGLKAPGALIDIDVRTGVSGRLTAEDQVNALVKQGNALPTVGSFALPILVHQWHEEFCRSPAQIGCGGRGRS